MTFRKTLLLQFLLSLTCVSTVFSQETWKPLGIYGVSNLGLAFEDRSRKLIVSSLGTFAASLDEGKTWQHYPNRFNTWYSSLYAAGPDSFLVSSYQIGNGVIASTDGGKSFFTRSSGLPSRESLSQAFTGNPLNRGEIYLCNDDIYRTTDFGGSWSLQSGGSSIGRRYMALGISPVDTNYMCVADNTHSRMYVSHDGGKTWPRVSEELKGYVRRTVITPKGNIYCNDHVSNDSGKTWRQIKAYITDNFERIDKLQVMDCAYNPKDGMVYLSDRFFRIGVVRARDGDSLFTSFALSSASAYSRVGAELAVDTLTGTVYAVNMDSLYKYNSSEYTCISNGLYTVPVPAIRATGDSGQVMLAGINYNFLRSVDGGRTWKELQGWGSSNGHFMEISKVIPGMAVMGSEGSTVLGFTFDYGDTIRACNIREPIWGQVRFDPFHGRDLYIGADANLLRIDDSLLRAHAGDNYYPEIVNRDCSILRFEFDPNRDGVLYASTYRNSIVRFTDRGHTATTVFVAPDSVHPYLTAVALSEKDPERVYVGSTKGCYVSSDSGATWKLSTNGLESKFVYSLKADPDLSGVVYAGTYNDCGFGAGEDVNCRGGMYQSTDGGESWFRMTDSHLFNWNIHAIEFARNPRRLIAGTECGAYEYILPAITATPSSVVKIVSTILEQNYPNPFSDETTISWKLDEARLESILSLDIVDVLGREIIDLTGKVNRDHTRIQLSSNEFPVTGMYVYRLSYKDHDGSTHTEARRMSVIRLH